MLTRNEEEISYTKKNVYLRVRFFEILEHFLILKFICKNLLWIYICFDFLLYPSLSLFFVIYYKTRSRIRSYQRFCRIILNFSERWQIIFFFFFLQMHAKDKGKINGKGFLKYQMSFTWVRVSSLWQFVWKNATIKNSFNSKNHFQYLYGWIRDKEK